MTTRDLMGISEREKALSCARRVGGGHASTNHFEGLWRSLRGICLRLERGARFPASGPGSDRWGTGSA